MHHANQTSFKPGQKPSPKTIQKMRLVWVRRLRDPNYRHPALGCKHSKESIRKRSETRHRLALGHRFLVRRSKHRAYWQIRTESGLRYEHRVIMEAALRRKLKREELVHHINGDSLDNRLENLQIMEIGDHIREHHLLPKNQWSKKHDACQRCGDSSHPHAGNGLCNKCYLRQWVKTSNK